MTPSHHGLGSVVLCTAGTTPSPWTCATSPARAGSAGIAITSSTWPPAWGWRRPSPSGCCTCRRRPAACRSASRRCRSRSTPASASRSAPLAGAETARHFEAMAQVNGQWYLVLDVRPFTGGSAHAAEEHAGRREGPRTGEETPASRARTRLARRAALGHLVVFSAETSQVRARIRWPTRSARRRSSRSRSSRTSRRCRWRPRTCAASATGAAARSSSSTCPPG